MRKVINHKNANNEAIISYWKEIYIFLFSSNYRNYQGCTIILTWQIVIIERSVTYLLFFLLEHVCEKNQITAYLVQSVWSFRNFYYTIIILLMESSLFVLLLMIRLRSYWKRTLFKLYCIIMVGLIYFFNILNRNAFQKYLQNGRCKAL